MNQAPKRDSTAPKRMNRPLAIASTGWLVLTLLLLVAAAVIPPGKQAGIPAAFYYLLLFGLGLCIFTFAFVYSYNAWTKDAQDYLAWFSQATGAARWQISIASRNPSYALWQTRLVTPLGVLFGAALMTLTGYLILVGWPIR